jgi:hypothetical protein
VYSRKAPDRDDFCRTAKARFGTKVETVEELEPAVRAADVLVTATNAAGPALRAAMALGRDARQDGWNPMRSMLRPISAPSWWQSLIVNRSRGSLPLRGLTMSCLVTANQRRTFELGAIPELGGIVARRVARPQGINVFCESQGGFGDLIF